LLSGKVATLKIEKDSNGRERGSCDGDAKDSERRRRWMLVQWFNGSPTKALKILRQQNELIVT
jgi:hypothetical protein